MFSQLRGAIFIFTFTGGNDLQLTQGDQLLETGADRGQGTQVSLRRSAGQRERQAGDLGEHHLVSFRRR